MEKRVELERRGKNPEDVSIPAGPGGSFPGRLIYQRGVWGSGAAKCLYAHTKQAPERARCRWIWGIFRRFGRANGVYFAGEGAESGQLPQHEHRGAYRGVLQPGKLEPHQCGLDFAQGLSETTKPQEIRIKRQQVRFEARDSGFGAPMGFGGFWGGWVFGEVSFLSLGRVC